MRDLRKGATEMKRSLIFTSCLVLSVLTANSAGYIADSGRLWLIPIFILFLFAFNLLPLLSYDGVRSFRLRMCAHGVVCLSVFAFALAPTAVLQVVYILKTIPQGYYKPIISAVVAFLTLAVLFWNGMITVYLFSTQLGITHRLRGLLFGFVPVLNFLYMLKIIRVVAEETAFEKKKLQINQNRAEDKICATKYPILLVHGVCFRDVPLVDYWGRIPSELERNGAKCYHGNHDSAAAVKDSAKEIASRIKYITDDLGFGKVNIIAHSKGGLDCRYAVAKCGVADRVASLITVNTPHRGCKYADYLLTKISEGVQTKVASIYNKAMKKLGDADPDFLSAMNCLTESECCLLDKELSEEEKVFGMIRISIGSHLNSAKDAKFPLRFTHDFVKRFVGANDGLVSVDSFSWGDRFIMLENTGKRGLSHADVIDLNCENIPGFDVREFYVKLASDLKNRGC